MNLQPPQNPQTAQQGNQPNTQLTPDAFKQRILSKYPNGVASDGTPYSQMDATDLTQRIVSKYPDAVTSDGYKYSQFLPAQAPTTQAPEQSLGSELEGRWNDATKAFGDAFSGKMSAPIISAPLQIAGAAAGAVGDVVNKGLELIPGVKSLEGLIGQGAGSLLKTQTGQKVAQAIQKFTQDHPELSSDIGAGFNIATALPIFDGLGAIKDLALDGSANALKGIAEKGAVKDLTEAASRTIGGRNALAGAPDAISTLVKERAIPDLEGTRLNTQNAFQTMEDAIGAKGDALDAILSKTPNSTHPVIDLTQMRNRALESAEKDLEGQGNYQTVVNKINELFDTAEGSKKAITVDGDQYVNLKDANFFKRQARTGVRWDDDVGRSAGYHVGQAYMKGIEDIATQNGLGDVHAANAELGKLLQAQNMLRYVNGKTIKSGLLGSLIRQAAAGGASAVGETVGNMAGVPFAGALAGRGLESVADKGLLRSGGLLRNAILDRTGPNAVKSTLPSLLGRGAKAAASTVLQRQNAKR